MALSGNEVLTLIERMLSDTRNEITSIDTRLARSTAELERLRQAEIGCLSVLAKTRLREIEAAPGELQRAAASDAAARTRDECDPACAHVAPCSFCSRVASS